MHPDFVRVFLTGDRVEAGDLPFERDHTPTKQGNSDRKSALS
jgi:hypothetical protein